MYSGAGCLSRSPAAMSLANRPREIICIRAAEIRLSIGNIIFSFTAVLGAARNPLHYCS